MKHEHPWEHKNNPKTFKLYNDLAGYMDILEQIENSGTMNNDIRKKRNLQFIEGARELIEELNPYPKES